MRTAKIQGEREGLFQPGALVAVVGGTLLLLLLLYFVTSATTLPSAPYVADADLPRMAQAEPTIDPDTLVPVTLTKQGIWGIDDFFIGDADFPAQLERWLTAERSGVIFRVHEHASAEALRSGIAAADEAGALRVEIRVRTGDGRIGSIPIDTAVPVPGAADAARAQDYVDALATKKPK